MNRRTMAEQVLWTGSTICLLIGCIRIWSPDQAITTPAIAVQLADPPARPTSDSLADAIGIITEGNLFRSNRQSSTARAEPTTPEGFGMLSQPPQAGRPQLSLRGIVGGPPWSVVVIGVPGREGPVVLRQGQPDAGLELRAIKRDTAIVSGRDTTWRLTMGRAW